jgi:hypothetical protein
MYMLTFEMRGKPVRAKEIGQSLEGIVKKVRNVERCIVAQAYRGLSFEKVFFSLKSGKSDGRGKRAVVFLLTAI